MQPLAVDFVARKITVNVVNCQVQSIRDKKFKRGEGEEKRRECRSRAASVRLDTTGLTQASQVVASVIITDREF